MIGEKFQPFKVQLLQSDRLPKFVAIAPKTHRLKYRLRELRLALC